MIAKGKKKNSRSITKLRWVEKKKIKSREGNESYVMNSNQMTLGEQVQQANQMRPNRNMIIQETIPVLISSSKWPNKLENGRLRKVSEE